MTNAAAFPPLQIFNHSMAAVGCWVNAFVGLTKKVVSKIFGHNPPPLGLLFRSGEVRCCQLPPSVNPPSSGRRQDVWLKHTHSEAQRGHKLVEAT